MQAKKTRIGKSNIAGRGVFADEDIAKGEFVMFLEGKLIKKDPEEKLGMRAGKTWMNIGPGLWVSPIARIKYMNHSCAPNLGMKTTLELYAIKEIKKGEELTLDYSTVDSDDLWKMPCSCGAKNCRKLIGPIQSLPHDVYMSYLPFITEYFQNVYLEYNGNKELGRPHG